LTCREGGFKFNENVLQTFRHGLFIDYVCGLRESAADQQDYDRIALAGIR
jgi:hypothetical protein